MNNVTHLRNKDREMCIHDAVFREDDKIVAILIKEDVDLEKKDEHDNTPLGTAVELGNEKITRMLLNAGANPELGNWTSPLEVACINGNVDIVNLLISAGADVNVRLEKGSTALISAAAHGHTEVVKRLVENGGDVNVKSKKANFALLAAAHSGNTDLFNFLFELTSLELRKLLEQRIE